MKAKAFAAQFLLLLIISFPTPEVIGQTSLLPWNARVADLVPFLEDAVT